VAGATAPTSRLVVLRRPAAGAKRPPAAPVRTRRSGAGWGWAAASRRKLIAHALSALGKRSKIPSLGAAITLTPSKPMVAGRGHFFCAAVNLLDADPAAPEIEFVPSLTSFNRGFGFWALLPPHRAAMIDVPMHPGAIEKPLSLRVKVYRAVMDPFSVETAAPLADQTVTFDAPVMDQVHLGVLLPDVGAANAGTATSVWCRIAVKSESTAFKFPSLTVTPL
jgi:hypothetical protein